MTPDGWWWCDEPGTEEVRMRVGRGSVGYFFTCKHGRWESLGDARAAHAITVEAVEVAGELE